TIKRDLVAGEEIRNSAARAIVVESGPIRLEIALVSLEQGLAHGDLGDVFVLDVSQLEVARDLRVDLFLRQDLDHIDVILPGQQVAKGLFVAFLVHKVAQDNDDSLSGGLNGKGAKCLP